MSDYLRVKAAAAEMAARRRDGGWDAMSLGERIAVRAEAARALLAADAVDPLRRPQDIEEAASGLARRHV